MGCGRLSCREEFQDLLARLNPGAAEAAARLAAAADAAEQDALRMLRAGSQEPVHASLQVRWLAWARVRVAKCLRRA